MTITELLKKAADAEAPANTKSRSSWAALFPVIDRLVRDRQFSVWNATAWLVDNAAIPNKSRRVVYHSYLGYAKRRAKPAESK